MRLATTGGRLITADWSEAIVSYKDVREALCLIFLFVPCLLGRRGAPL